MKYTPTKLNNPCPICSDTSGDCRTSEANYVLCHEFIEQDSGKEGYRYTKPTTNGVWGIHVADDGKEFDREKYERYLAQKEAQKKNKEEFLANNALDADGRDKAIRKLSRYVGLNQEQTQALRDRGLNDPQIKKGNFFSIDPWTTLAISIPTNLPGINYVGNGFATKNAGYACPAFDLQGRIIGWQMRLCKVTNNNKYRWAKGTFSSHLPNGELPVTIVQPSDNTSKTIYLSEGLLKAYVASSKHNLPVCGAAGGYFSGSPQQMKEILKDYEKIVIVPDAGDILNDQVMHRWQKQINYLKQFGKQISIAWWDQVNKSIHQDIDELENLDKVEFITTEKFSEISSKQQYIDKTRKLWRESKHFTANQTIHQQFFQAKLPATNTITFIKSTTGSGKTTKLLEWFKLLRTIGAIALGYRNTLLLQWCAKSRFYHLHEHDGMTMIGDVKSQIALCVDSLWRFKPEDFDGKVLILDEVCSVIRHLLFSSTVKNREHIQKLFEEAIRRCDRVICLDGMMADWVVDYLTEFCPAKKVVTIENTWKANKAKVNFLQGTLKTDGKLRVNDLSPWLEELFNKAALPAIGIDSQVTAESLDNLLSSNNCTVLRVDSKTVKEDHVKEFLSNCDAYLKKHKPDILIYTPSAESGVDVSITNYFSHHFCFFFGVLGVDSILQLTARIRDVNCPKYFWCREWVSLPDLETIRTPWANQVAKIVDQNLIRDIYCSLSGEERKEQLISAIRQYIEQSKNAHWDCATHLTAINNYEKSNLRACVLESLKAHGYEIQEITGTTDQEINQEVKKTSKLVKQKNCNDIFTAEDIPPEQASNSLAFDASWSDRCKLKKANIRRKLPGIEQSDRWNPDLIYQIEYQNRNLINKQELFWLLNNPQAAQLIQQEKYFNLCQKYLKHEQISLWKVKTRLAIVYALRDLGIHEIINNPDREYTEDNPVIKAICQKGKQKKYRQILGRTPGKYPLRYVGSLLGMVDLGWESKQVRKGDRQIRVYKLSTKKLSDLDRQAILKCIDQKWQHYLTDEVKKPDWSTVTDEVNLPSKSSIKTCTSKVPQVLAKHSFNPVTDEPIIVNKQQELSVTENSSPLDTQEAIADLADMLETIDNAEQLRELQTVPEFTVVRLQKAAKLLSWDQYQRIKQWATYNRTSTA